MNETDLKVVNNSIKLSTSEISKNLYLFTEDDAQITEEDAQITKDVQITEDDVQIREDVQISSKKPNTPNLTSSCSISSLNVPSSSLVSNSKNKINSNQTELKPLKTSTAQKEALDILCAKILFNATYLFDRVTIQLLLNLLKIYVRVIILLIAKR